MKNQVMTLFKKSIFNPLSFLFFLGKYYSKNKVYKSKYVVKKIIIYIIPYLFPINKALKILFFTSKIFWMLCLSFLMRSNVLMAQIAPPLEGKCKKLWEIARDKNTFKAYKMFSENCAGKRFANIARNNMKHIKLRCNNTYEIYFIIKDTSYLRSYITSDALRNYFRL